MDHMVEHLRKIVVNEKNAMGKCLPGTGPKLATTNLFPLLPGKYLHTCMILRSFTTTTIRARISNRLRRRYQSFFSSLQFPSSLAAFPLVYTTFSCGLSSCSLFGTGKVSLGKYFPYLFLGRFLVKPFLNFCKIRRFYGVNSLIYQLAL